MTTLANRPHTALVVIDVQVGVVEDAYERESVLAKINALVARARAARVPVIWVQHHDEELVEGSPAWAYVDELVAHDGEPVVHKSFGDSFEDTTLESVLAERGVGSLIVVGAQTEQCIRSTLHGAITRGYDATLVSDAHTTQDLTQWGQLPPADVVRHTNLYWRYHEAPGRRGGTVTTDEVQFAPPAA